MKTAEEEIEEKKRSQWTNVSTLQELQLSRHEAMAVLRRQDQRLVSVATAVAVWKGIKHREVHFPQEVSTLQRLGRPSRWFRFIALTIRQTITQAIEIAAMTSGDSMNINPRDDMHHHQRQAILTTKNAMITWRQAEITHTILLMHVIQRKTTKKSLAWQDMAEPERWRSCSVEESLLTSRKFIRLRHCCTITRQRLIVS